jgi:hypothetical protein
MKSPAEYQRLRRDRLRSMGYKRVELEVSPELFESLRPYLSNQPGHDIVQLLKSIAVLSG